MKEKVVLAYSGGLDTSIIIPWLKENYDIELQFVGMLVKMIKWMGYMKKQLKVEQLKRM